LRDRHRDPKARDAAPIPGDRQQIDDTLPNLGREIIGCVRGAVDPGWRIAGYDFSACS
jgi:hypothetical protein